MFGKSLMLDCYDCEDKKLDCMETHYRFLEELAIVLDMHPLCPPVIYHGTMDIKYNPETREVTKSEKFPDKAGISGWIGLIYSGIQIHSCEPSHFMSLDVYSCKPFDNNIVIELTQKYFGFKDFDEIEVDRGQRY